MTVPVISPSASTGSTKPDFLSALVENDPDPMFASLRRVAWKPRCRREGAAGERFCAASMGEPLVSVSAQHSSSTSPQVDGSRVSEPSRSYGSPLSSVSPKAQLQSSWNHGETKQKQPSKGKGTQVHSWTPGRLIRFAIADGGPHSQSPPTFRFTKHRVKMVEVNRRLLLSRVINVLITHTLLLPTETK